MLLSKNLSHWWATGTSYHIEACGSSYVKILLLVERLGAGFDRTASAKWRSEAMSSLNSLMPNALKGMRYRLCFFFLESYISWNSQNDLGTMQCCTQSLNFVCCLFFRQTFSRLSQWSSSVFSAASPSEVSVMSPTAPGNFDLCSINVCA